MSDNCADVVIHIDEELDDANIHEVEWDLAQLNGVISACVHEKARHLMLVDYDPQSTRSGFLLNRVKNRGLHAELIGL